MLLGIMPAKAAPCALKIIIVDGQTVGNMIQLYYPLLINLFQFLLRSSRRKRIEMIK
jgi:hypothetical protein